MSNNQSNQYATNDDQSQQQDHAFIYIEDMIRGVSPTPQDHAFIFRVHHVLRTTNEKVYEPEILAIGPYHYKSDRCKFMEEPKLRSMQWLLRRRGEGSVQRYMPILREMERQARDCYAETIHLAQNEFLAMMLIDGCFIVDFLRKHSRNGPRIKAERILFLPFLRHDLQLLENQLPLFVLNKLYEETKGPNEHCEFIDIAVGYFCKQPTDLDTNTTLRDKLRDSKHLLHLIHTYWTFGLPNPPKLEGSTALTKVTFSATELREAGVRLRATQERRFMDIKFENGILKIPVITIEDGTESLFRNMIAYEQHRRYRVANRVTAYILFMDDLVNSSKDVKLLRHQGIIRNYLGDDEVVAQMFNKMGDGVTRADFFYSEISSNVNAYCNKNWNVWWAKLRREYLHSPWGFLSVLAAIVLLLLTAAQTAFALLSYINPS